MGGGRGGIRTPGTVTRTPDFESGAFNHSATLPYACYPFARYRKTPFSIRSKRYIFRLDSRSRQADSAPPPPTLLQCWPACAITALFVPLRFRPIRDQSRLEQFN